MKIFRVFLFCILGLVLVTYPSWAQMGGDFDENGKLEFADFLLFAQAYGSNRAAFDLNGNGRVDFPDFLSFTRLFRQSPHYVVTFADPGIEVSVREAIGRPVGPIEAQDLKDLSRLEVVDRSVKDLGGLEHLTALEVLWIKNNEELFDLDFSERQEFEVDLKPLSGLSRLKSLMLHDVAPSSLEPLAGLTGLEELSLLNTVIRQFKRPDLSSLSGLSGLRRLAIVGLTPEYENFPALSKLTSLRELIVVLPFRDTPADLTFLSGLTSLEHLAVRSQDIEDLSPLSNLKGLTRLYVGSNPISREAPALHFTERQIRMGSKTQVRDLSPLAGLTALTELVLGVGGKAEDLSPLSNLTSLTRLEIRSDQSQGNRGSDISPLSNLTFLEHLSVMWGNPVEDLSPLSNLTSLKSLRIDGRFDDISPLSNLTGLTSLHLGSNRVEDLSAVASLKALEFFGLTSSPVRDLSPFVSLKALTYLYMPFNKIQSISALGDLPALEHLDLKGNQIQDLSALVNGRGLGADDFVLISQNPLSPEAVSEQIPALKSRGVSVIYDR